MNDTSFCEDCGVVKDAFNSLYTSSFDAGMPSSYVHYGPFLPG